MSALLEARALCKEFGRRPGALPAIAGVDLRIERGETVALVGESGCGKTTLARMLLRIVEPTSGEIRFLGRDLLALRGSAVRQIRRSLQMVFQDPYGSLDPRLSVADSIFEPLLIHRLAAPAEKSDRVAALLAEVGLDAAVAARFPHELSGGQRQRICIARALASGPELLVADEPVSALDFSVRGQIVNLLCDRQKERGLALLFIAHDLALVEQVADRIAVMYLGRIVETGPAPTVLSRPLHPYTALLLASSPGTRRGTYPELPARVHEPEAPAARATGCPFDSRCPSARIRCRQERPELSDAGGGVLTACHYPGEVHSAVPGDSGKWNFSLRST